MVAMSVVMTMAGGVGGGSIGTLGPTMEGTLYKWTNYWHGWQPRWFLLDQGVLTYYKSREEVRQGCKGSVKISACEIVPHQLDLKRLDIIIPSEQRYYLKAASETERQQWLVLLGSVKQASASGSAYSAGTSQSNLSLTAAATTVAAVHSVNGPPSQPFVNANAIKVKKSELQLCCDMVMQQAYAIKTSQETQAKLEAAATLNSTCDTFIRCLDSLMKLIERAERLDDEDNRLRMATARELRPPLLEFTNSHGTITGMVGCLEILQRKTTSEAHGMISATSLAAPSESVKISSAVIHRATTQKSDKNTALINGETAPNDSELTHDSFDSTSNNNNCNNKDVSHRTRILLGSNENTRPSLMTQEENDCISVSMLTDDLNANSLSSEVSCEASSPDEPNTFFSVMTHSFRDFHLVDKQIPIKEFLECCRELLPVFDALGSTAFAPVKMDIQGNIDKLEKHRKDSRCLTLQTLVQRELDLGTVWSKGSATDALLWLKRALAFICCFLKEACCQPGEVALAQCAAHAYGETLKKHHNFVVKGIFSVAVRALPYYSTFLKTMAPTPQASGHPQYEETLKRHGMEYTKQLQEIVTIIDVFYVRNDIVSPIDL
ncbi:pleckstrin homology domain-containing family A member 8-like isoform X1 [Varroa destructor]|uniref:Pleckstrin homology domain-containing family A member 8 n=2 Tax=Varroa destructor TaxID=109461 RepID=A0A7M7JNS0_VARDE|nr:pleckstrin homology domain-containing family A member 8-like isoform X1 [Varroa destructor]